MQFIRGPALAQVPSVCIIERMQLHGTATLICLLLALSSCADYDPPVQGDHTSEKYRADLEKCRSSSSEAVRLRNASTPEKWIISPITGPPAVHAMIRTCMQGKGYVLENATD